ncbi:hypothetical protein L2E82_35657 [Cichorium intybus]|uniref:Uncharacterized protein n=1 Tax=Cichorium intybus TaxID=13427 RepID=A0ACB9BPI7_CICIN|nr:hypothetical protein L2E82_35657 [Cichorium intybus]
MGSSPTAINNTFFSGYVTWWSQLYKEEGEICPDDIHPIVDDNEHEKIGKSEANGSVDEPTEQIGDVRRIRVQVAPATNIHEDCDRGDPRVEVEEVNIVPVGSIANQSPQPASESDLMEVNQAPTHPNQSSPILSRSLQGLVQMGCFRPFTSPICTKNNLENSKFGVGVSLGKRRRINR